MRDSKPPGHLDMLPGISTAWLSLGFSSLAWTDCLYLGELYLYCSCTPFPEHQSSLEGKEEQSTSSEGRAQAQFSLIGSLLDLLLHRETHRGWGSECTLSLPCPQLGNTFLGTGESTGVNKYT